MDRREFLRNMLYGAVAMPSLALGESVSVPVQTFEFWAMAPHGSWVHLVLVQHGDGSQTRYMNGSVVEPGSYREIILRDWFPPGSYREAIMRDACEVAKYDQELSSSEIRRYMECVFTT